MRDISLCFSIGGFVVGVLIRSFVDLGFVFPVFLLGLAVSIFLAEKKAILLSVFLVALGFGVLRFEASDRTNPRIILDSFLDIPVVLEGVIVDEPDEREMNTRLTVRVEKADGKDNSIHTKLLVVASREPKYRYGDRLRIEGKVEHPKDFIDEVTSREVSYRMHLSKDGIFYEIFQPRIELVGKGEGNFIVEKLFAFKNAFIQKVNTLIPEPHASLLGGLVVGAKQSLGKELLDDFRTVGVIHIVVLSGYNITIIALFIEWILSRLKKHLRLIVAAIVMTLFALMVGGSATVIRATVMALLVLLARGTGRIYQVTRALLLAGFLMLLHNPKILVFDVSFQLSFLATVGLIYVSPLIEPKVRFVTERFHMREIVVATLATQVFVLPFLLYKTGVLSVVSLPANLLILSAIPLTMLFGFLAGLFAFVSPVFALPFAYIAYGLLAYELAVVSWLSKFSFSAISITYFPLWLVISWYGVYAVLLIVWRRKQSTVALKQQVLS